MDSALPGNEALPPLSPATFESLLDPSLQLQFPSPPSFQEPRAPSPRNSYEPGTFVVQKILGHVLYNARLYFHVQWHGFPCPRDHTFEPIESFIDMSMPTRYAKRHGLSLELLKGSS